MLPRVDIYYIFRVILADIVTGAINHLVARYPRLGEKKIGICSRDTRVRSLIAVCGSKIKTSLHGSVGWLGRQGWRGYPRRSAGSILARLQGYLEFRDLRPARSREASSRSCRCSALLSITRLARTLTNIRTAGLGVICRSCTLLAWASCGS